MEMTNFKDEFYTGIMEYITGDLKMQPPDEFMKKVGAFLKEYQEHRATSKYYENADWNCQVVEQESHFKAMLGIMLFSRASLRIRKKLEAEGTDLSTEETMIVLQKNKELQHIIKESIELITHAPNIGHSEFGQHVFNRIFSRL
jgi:putative cell wall-binding protein